MKFFIETLGCKVNFYESNYIKETLLNKGFLVAENLENANIIILNTCSVTNTSNNKCLKVARRMRRENAKAIFVVCGCSTQNDYKMYQDIDIDIILGNKNKSKISDLIIDYIKKPSKFFQIENPFEFIFEDMEITQFENIRAYIKIQDGCNNYCSYCIIPYLRGNIRFKKYNTILKEAKRLVDNNYQEIVLTGIHTGTYHDEFKTLVNLINDLTKISGLKRLRLSSIEVTELGDDFIELLKNNPILCDNLHIPLQAGSNEMLKIMNRKYNLEFFENKINEIRKIRPNIYISTDIIVGHPGESEELFQKTLEFVQKIKFSKIHVFPYSDREGTKASKMNNHIENKDIKSRVKKLIELGNDLEKKYHNKFINQESTILIEEIKEGISYGHTNNFLKLKINKVIPINTFYKIIIKNENIC